MLEIWRCICVHVQKEPLFYNEKTFLTCATVHLHHQVCRSARGPPGVYVSGEQTHRCDRCEDEVFEVKTRSAPQWFIMWFGVFPTWHRRTHADLYTKYTKSVVAPSDFNASTCILKSVISLDCFFSYCGQQLIMGYDFVEGPPWRLAVSAVAPRRQIQLLFSLHCHHLEF